MLASKCKSLLEVSLTLKQRAALKQEFEEMERDCPDSVPIFYHRITMLWWYRKEQRSIYVKFVFQRQKVLISIHLNSSLANEWLSDRSLSGDLSDSVWWRGGSFTRRTDRSTCWTVSFPRRTGCSSQVLFTDGFWHVSLVYKTWKNKVNVLSKFSILKFHSRDLREHS